MPVPDPELVRRLELKSVAITATLSNGGDLEPASAEVSKLAGLLVQPQFAAVTTVVVSDEQDLSRLGLVADQVSPARGVLPGGLVVLKAKNLADMVDLLAIEKTVCGHPIINCSDEWVGRSFVSRRWIAEEVEECISGLMEQPYGSYLLLMARPKFGKSSFVATWKQDHEDAIVHFIRRGRPDWAAPERFIPSLTSQLRLAYRLPERAGESELPVEDQFLTVLQRISEERLGCANRAVIFLDGLDEVQCRGGGPASLFGTFLPLPLPRRIFVVITSRPLEVSGIPMGLRVLDLEDTGLDHGDDIPSYVRSKAEALGVQLDETFIQRIVTRADGLLGWADMILHSANLAIWRDHPEQMPKGPEEWFAGEWSRLEAHHRDRGVSAVAGRTFIRIIALAAPEVLSRNDFDAFLYYQDNQDAARTAVTDELSALDLRRELNQAVGASRPFLKPFDNGALNPTFHLYHPDFQTWVLARTRKSDQRRLHQWLADACSRWRVYEEPEWAGARGYALDRRLHHLDGACDGGGFLEAALDADYVRARLSRPSGFASYLQDLKQAMSSDCSEVASAAHFIDAHLGDSGFGPASFSGTGATDIQAQFAQWRVEYVTGPPSRPWRRLLTALGLAFVLVGSALVLWRGRPVPRAASTARAELVVLRGTAAIEGGRDGETGTLSPGDRAPITAGSTIAVDARGAAQLRWSGRYTGTLLAGAKAEVVNMATVENALELNQTAGTMWHAVGPTTRLTVELAAAFPSVADTLRLVAGDGPMAAIASFAVDDPETLWIGLDRGRATLLRGGEQLGLTELQSAFVTADVPLPPAYQMRRAALDRCLGRVQSGTAQSVSLPREVCCVVSDGPVAPLDQPIGEVGQGEPLEVGAVIGAMLQTARHDRLYVKAYSGSTAGWVRSGSVACTGQVSVVVPTATAPVPLATPTVTHPTASATMAVEPKTSEPRPTLPGRDKEETPQEPEPTTVPIIITPSDLRSS